MDKFYNTATDILETQVGYNRYFAKEFGQDAEKLQKKCFLEGNKPTTEQLEDLKKLQYMSWFYWEEAKIIIKELKKEKALNKLPSTYNRG